MTWIKPSFLWMMYRAGWGEKDEGQCRILAVNITHEGFAWALEHSCGSRPPPELTAEEWKAMKNRIPVRIQWDPERDLHHAPLPHRAIQIGLTGEAVQRYCAEWIVSIEDVTELARAIHGRVRADKIQDAEAMLPIERPYNFATKRC